MRKVLINIILLILAFTIQICVFPQIAFLSSARTFFSFPYLYAGSLRARSPACFTA